MRLEDFTFGKKPKCINCNNRCPDVNYIFCSEKCEEEFVEEANEE